MTEQQHPIAPSPQQVNTWSRQWLDGDTREVYAEWLAARAAQWGADQELEACCEWLEDPDLNVDTYKLREARRPKPPPSLKEQAQRELDRLIALIPSEGALAMAEPIRQALEALPDA